MKPENNLMTPRAFAEHLGFRPHYGNQLLKDGRLVLAPDGKHVLVAESLERYQATRDPSRQAVADRHAAARAGATPADGAEQAAGDGAEDGADAPLTQAEGSYDYQSARAKREFWAAEREHASWRRDAGELMERAEVVAAFADAGATLRSRLEALPAMLAPQLEGRDESAIRATIADHVEQLLRDMAEKFARMAGDAERAAHG